MPTPEEVRQTVILQSFFPRKLRENERIWAKKGALIPDAPLDSTLVSLPERCITVVEINCSVADRGFSRLKGGTLNPTGGPNSPKKAPTKTT